MGASAAGSFVDGGCGRAKQSGLDLFDNERAVSLQVAFLHSNLTPAKTLRKALAFDVAAVLVRVTVMRAVLLKGNPLVRIGGIRPDDRMTEPVAQYNVQERLRESGLHQCQSHHRFRRRIGSHSNQIQREPCLPHSTHARVPANDSLQIPNRCQRLPRQGEILTVFDDDRVAGSHELIDAQQ